MPIVYKKGLWMKKPFRKFNLAEATQKERQQYFDSYKKMLIKLPDEPVMVIKEETEEGVNFTFETLEKIKNVKNIG